MATMNRNINLEEINSEAFLGISYLNYQSTLQKIVFWGGIIVALIWNLVGNFVFHANPGVIVVCTLIPIFVGAILGCNYNQDLSLIKYMYLLLSKSSKVLVSKPTEDLEQIKVTSVRLAKNRELREQQLNAAKPEEQKKLLFKLLIGVGAMVLFFVLLIVIILCNKTEEVHHMIELTS